jgi:hypothetical protein
MLLMQAVMGCKELDISLEITLKKIISRKCGKF